MRTTDQWLALPDDKLPTELARVFTPEPWKHDIYYRSNYCYKCQCNCNEKKPCPIPDLIKIDWDTAMEKFRQHSPSRTILRQVCGPEPIDCISWFLVSAKPKHYLIAAAMAVERKEE